MKTPVDSVNVLRTAGQPERWQQIGITSLNILKSIFSEPQKWHAPATAIAFFVGIFFIATTYIDSRVKKITTDREFLSSLAHRIQPSVIIDEDGRIEADLGGCEFIDSIKFMVNTNLETIYNLSLGISNTEWSEFQRNYPVSNQIVLTPKNHLAYAPLLTPLPPHTCTYSTRRGEGHSWIYEITFLTGYPQEEQPPLRVKFEIIR